MTQEAVKHPTLVSPPATKAAALSRKRLRRYLAWLKILPFAIAIGLVVRHRLVAPVPVHQLVVDRGDVVREVYGRATIESRREVQLGFDLVGRVSDVLVDEGDRVKLGQVVAHLAPEQLNADVHATSSGVPLAKAAMARLEADDRRAQATLTFAEQEAARMRRLTASGSVTARDLDLAEQQLSLAKAELDRVRAAQTEALKQIAVASGATESKAATVTRAVLVSPFDGIVIRRFKRARLPRRSSSAITEAASSDSRSSGSRFRTSMVKGSRSRKVTPSPRRTASSSQMLPSASPSPRSCTSVATTIASSA